MRTLQSILGSSIDDLTSKVDKIAKIEAWCKSAETGPGHNHLAGLFLNPSWDKPKWSINKNGEIDIDGNIRISGRGDAIDELPDYIQFGTVTGSVIVDRCRYIKSFRGWPKKITGRLELNEIYEFDDDTIKTSDIEYCGRLELTKLGKITRSDIVKECELLHIASCDKIRNFKKTPKINNSVVCVIQHQVPMSFEGLPRDLDTLYIEHIKIPESNLKTLPKDLGTLKFRYVHGQEWYTKEDFQKVLPKTDIKSI